jgi:hypothetical protein
MPTFDCYCAFCGGPLYNCITLGSTSAKALAWRKGKVDAEKRRRAGKTGNDVDTMEEDGEDDEKLDSWEEEHSYDPKLVSKDSTAWLMDCRCVGFNANAPGVSKYVMERNSITRCHLFQSADFDSGTSLLELGRMLTTYDTVRNACVFRLSAYNYKGRI